MSEAADAASDEIHRRTLEYLCWHFGSKGDRFWPIDETAEGCMEAVEDAYEQSDEMDREEGLAWEEGQHSRAVIEASEFFEQLHKRGYNPVEMATREIERSREEGLDVDDIDWDWLRLSSLPEEYKAQFVDTDPTAGGEPT